MRRRRVGAARSGCEGRHAAIVCVREREGVAALVDAASRRGAASLRDAQTGAMCRQGGGDVRSHGAHERETLRGFTLRRAALAFADWEGPYDGDVRGLVTR